MKKLVFAFLGTLFLFLIFTLYPSRVFAQCQIIAPDSASLNSSIQVTINDIPSGDNPGLRLYDASDNALFCIPLSWPTANISRLGLPATGGFATLKAELTADTSSDGLTFTCGDTVRVLCSKIITLTGEPLPSPSCSVRFAPMQIIVNAQNLLCSTPRYCFSIINSNGFRQSTQCESWGKQCTGSMSITFIPQIHWQAGRYQIEIHSIQETESPVARCSLDYSGESNRPGGTPYEICQGNEKCEKCIKTKESGGNYTYEKGGSWTALGCIPTGEPNQLVAWILARAMGIGGGVAFLLTILGAFQVITSGGDPDKVKTGKEMITAAISGLLLIIFSLFLLQLIGVKILNIPGFGQ